MTREPLLITMVVVGLLQIAFQHADVSADTDALEATVNAVLLAIGTFWSRRKVTPVADPRIPAGRL